MSQEAIAPNSWSLLDQGLLWKEVLKSAADQESFRKRAEEFVKQLQQAAKPKDALEGLFLDRMASGYLRKLLLIETEAKYNEYRRGLVRDTMEGSPSAEIAVFALATSTLEPNDCIFKGMMEYESSLDRAFHRDTILLLQLQQMSAQRAASPPRKQAQSASKTGGEGIEKVAIG
jgi:hypothetical protein